MSPSSAAGDIGLGDDIAVAADRLDHLVEVGAVLRVELEHSGTARALKRFEDDVALVLLGEGLDVGRVLGDQRFRARLAGKLWK
jgi:hypothetical protein